MAGLRLLSWNVNGVRAVLKKGFLPWLDATRPDILCLQEIRADPGQLPEALASPLGYHAVWNPSRVKKGYSGTAVLSRRAPLSVEAGLGEEEFDAEGRTLILEFDDFVLLNAYFPNGRRDHSRVDYKLRFYDRFLARCQELRAEGKSVVFCGDLNTSHRPIDLARPKANENTTGFLPEERAWIDRYLEAGFVDTFRHLHPRTEGAYTWWSMPLRARERNVGWRLDYFFVAHEMLDRVRQARILSEVMGSDHCPVELRLRG